MSGRARCSVLISVYNGEKFLDHFIENLLKQTCFTSLECVFLNANSTDKSKQIIENFSFLRNFKIVNFLEKVSLYEAWNVGIKESSAPLISNWNIDDRRLPNSLEIQISQLEKENEYDLCYGKTLITTVPNENVEDCKSKNIFGFFEDGIDNLLRVNSPHCLPVWRRSLHQRFGLFDAKYFSAADYDMWLRAKKGGSKFLPINTVVGSYYENPRGISTNSASLAKAIAEVKEVREKYK